MMITTNLKKFIERQLSLCDIDYYLSWADRPAKKYRCWINRDNLSPSLQKYIDTKKLPCTY